jgi:hypothetical protein
MRAADGADPSSFSNRMRNRRFSMFEKLCAGITRPMTILDIGGKGGFWEQRGWADRDDVHVTLVNIELEPQTHENIVPRLGDASDLHDIASGSFDVVFSNSVIEHLFTWEKQVAMAAEVRRVGVAHWVQTPNFWFPIEPHFHVPGWQWLPRGVRTSVIRRVKCGQRGPYRDRDEAEARIDEIRLLAGKEMRTLFPESTIWGERFAGLVKSWVAYGGFPGGTEAATDPANRSPETAPAR